MIRSAHGARENQLERCRIGCRLRQGRAPSGASAADLWLACEHCRRLPAHARNRRSLRAQQGADPRGAARRVRGESCGAGDRQRHRPACRALRRAPAALQLAAERGRRRSCAPLAERVRARRIAQSARTDRARRARHALAARRAADAIFSANTLHIMAWDAVRGFLSRRRRRPRAPAACCACTARSTTAAATRATATRSSTRGCKTRDPHSALRDFEARRRAARARRGSCSRPITPCPPTTVRSCGGARRRVAYSDPMDSGHDGRDPRRHPHDPATTRNRGIIFRDITTLLGNARVFRAVVDQLVEPWAAAHIDRVAGIEARGFILGGALAHQLSAGFVPIRKKGKLPHATVRVAYSLEYGLDEMEMHRDAVRPGERIILVDDLIATGGTAARRGAAAALARRAGARGLLHRGSARSGRLGPAGRA